MKRIKRLKEMSAKRLDKWMLVIETGDSRYFRSFRTKRELSEYRKEIYTLPKDKFHIFKLTPNYIESWET